MTTLGLVLVSLVGMLALFALVGLLTAKPRCPNCGNVAWRANGMLRCHYCRNEFEDW